MTSIPEVVLAKGIRMCYSTIAIITNCVLALGKFNP